MVNNEEVQALDGVEEEGEAAHEEEGGEGGVQVEVRRTENASRSEEERLCREVGKRQGEKGRACWRRQGAAAEEGAAGGGCGGGGRERAPQIDRGCLAP